MLTVHCLKVVAKMATPLVLDDYCGSAIRGAFFHALLGRFCANHEAVTCTACPLKDACPVASLVAPLRDEHTGGYGQEIPRPYVIIPPEISEQRAQKAENSEEVTKTEKSGRKYAKGETFTFGLHLIGTSSKLFPYILRTLQEMERAGIGRPLAELKGQRGKFVICEVYAYHPYSEEQQLLWQQGSTQPQRPSLCITPHDVAGRAQHMASDHVTIDFTSPIRLVSAKQFLPHPDFRVFMLRLAERFEQLLQSYGQQSGNTSQLVGGREWYQLVEKQAQEVRLVCDETHWIDVTSYSARQKRHMPVGGFLGQATFQGNIAPLRELLAWGEVIGVGKSVTKGSGRYQIEGIGGEESCLHKSMEQRSCKH